jgi:hypothetical protein
MGRSGHGGLYTTDKAVGPAGAALVGVTLSDTVFEPVLEYSLLIYAPNGLLEAAAMNASIWGQSALLAPK